MQVPQPHTFPNLGGSNGEVLRFRFAVTWSYLSAPRAAAPKVPEPQPPQWAPLALSRGSDALPRSIANAAGAPASPANDQWEMVIPKMGRPPSAPPRAALRAAVPEKPAQPAAAPPEGLFRTVLSAPVIGPVETLWAKVPVNARIAGAIGVVLLLSAAFYSLGGSGTAPAATVEAGPALPVGLAGWVTNYSMLPTGQGMRRLSLVRASLNLTDFRLEFQGLIEAKALAWVFRVKDQKNFYVEKLEIVRVNSNPAVAPVVAPVVALTRFAVVDGAEQPRTQIQLPMQTYPDTLYRVRLDALGSHYTTWVQDQRVDDWTDARLAAGAVGLDSENGEIGTLKGNMTVYPLVKKP